MSHAAPRHLGIKGAWTDETQADWQEFQRKQQQEAVDAILDFLCSKAFALITVWRGALDYTVLGFSCLDLSSGSMSTCMVIALAFAHLGGPYLRSRVDEHSMLTASIFQMGVIMLLQAVNLSMSYSMDVELMQHRYYLSSQIGIVLLMSFIVYVPLSVHFFVGVPINFIAWLCFHRLVGFWQLHGLLKAATFGAMISLAVPGVFVLIERVQWSRFQANRQLARETEILQATQATLRCMLSGLWDASCICDVKGVISSSTQHVAQLLGGGKEIVGLCLNEFAANDVDRERLEKFLKSTASMASQQSLTLQVKARPQDVVGKPVTHDVALYGIELPPGAPFCSNRDGARLFVGIKANKSVSRGLDSQWTPFFERVKEPTLADQSTVALTDSASVFHGGSSVISADDATSQLLAATERAEGLFSLSREIAASRPQNDACTQTEATNDLSNARIFDPFEETSSSSEEDAAFACERVKLSLDSLCPADEPKSSSYAHACVDPDARQLHEAKDSSDADQRGQQIKLEFEEVSHLRSSAPMFWPTEISTAEYGQEPKSEQNSKDSDAKECTPTANEEEMIAPRPGPITLSLDSLVETTSFSSGALPCKAEQSSASTETGTFLSNTEHGKLPSSAHTFWPGLPPNSNQPFAGKHPLGYCSTAWNLWQSKTGEAFATECFEDSDDSDFDFGLDITSTTGDHLTIESTPLPPQGASADSPDVFQSVFDPADLQHGKQSFMSQEKVSEGKGPSQSELANSTDLWPSGGFFHEAAVSAPLWWPTSQSSTSEGFAEDAPLKPRPEPWPESSHAEQGVPGSRELDHQESATGLGRSTLSLDTLCAEADCNTSLPPGSLAFPMCPKEPLDAREPSARLPPGLTHCLERTVSFSDISDRFSSDEEDARKHATASQSATAKETPCVSRENMWQSHQSVSPVEACMSDEHIPALPPAMLPLPLRLISPADTKQSDTNVQPSTEYTLRRSQSDSSLSEVMSRFSSDEEFGEKNFLHAFSDVKPVKPSPYAPGERMRMAATTDSFTAQTQLQTYRKTPMKVRRGVNDKSMNPRAAIKPSGSTVEEGNSHHSAE